MLSPTNMLKKTTLAGSLSGVQSPGEGLRTCLERRVQQEPEGMNIIDPVDLRHRCSYDQKS